MDSAVREISSSAPAQASVEPRASPPNAIATPAIACRRVGPLASASRFVLSLIIIIIVLPNSCVHLHSHNSTTRKYVQDNISLGGVNQVILQCLKKKEASCLTPLVIAQESRKILLTVRASCSIAMALRVSLSTRSWPVRA